MVRLCTIMTNPTLPSQEITEFIQSIGDKNAAGGRIAARIDGAIRQLHPAVTAQIKYGGILYSIGCGVFSYEKHVSLEFSKGALLEDNYKLLEGKGKYRRHIKFSTIAQSPVSTTLSYYLRQLPIDQRTAPNEQGGDEVVLSQRASD